MSKFIAIARHIRPYTRTIDWALLSLAIWGVVIHVVVGWIR